MGGTSAITFGSTTTTSAPAARGRQEELEFHKLWASSSFKKERKLGDRGAKSRKPNTTHTKNVSEKGSKLKSRVSDLHVISALGAGREALQGPGSARRPLPKGRQSSHGRSSDYLGARPQWRNPLCRDGRKSWTPTLLFPDSERPVHSGHRAQLSTQTLNHRTDTVSPRPVLLYSATQHRDQTIPLLSPREPAPSPASSGGPVRGPG